MKGKSIKHYRGGSRSRPLPGKILEKPGEGSRGVTWRVDYARPGIRLLQTTQNSWASIMGVLLLILLSLPVHLLAQKDNTKFERIQAVQGQRLGSIWSL
ncbi:MAG: hypothetical protein ACE5G1_17550, partial [bacterium]